MTGYSEEEKYWIWLAHIAEVTPKIFYQILSVFGCAQSFFDAVCKNSSLLEEVPEKTVMAAKAAASKQFISEAICTLKEKKMRAFTRLGDEYPGLLTQINYPPPVLFVKGSLKEAGETISIVGTRRPTRHAAALTEQISEELGKAGFTIVSGMAYGIDSCAHRGALASGSKTIAVLGCGADVVYPLENKELYVSIAQNGAVISELAPGTQPLAANFPARNRIVTGLSAGTLIVESELKGGTAISADMAITRHRDVFAVPGMSPMSRLPNALIKQGAVPVTCAGDILTFYGMNAKKSETSREQTQFQLDFLQRHIYNLLLKGDLSVENIAKSSEHSLSEVSAALTLLELGGLVKRLPGGKYGV